MNTLPPIRALVLLALALASVAGCQRVAEPARHQTRAPFEPTALIIADERGPLDADELARRRPAVIQYLVSRGYLSSPDALVDNPAQASRFIRVVFSPGGSFRITEFTLGNRARQIHTTSSLPGRSLSLMGAETYLHLGHGSADPYILYEPLLPYSAPPRGYRPPDRAPRLGDVSPRHADPARPPDRPRGGSPDVPSSPPATTPAAPPPSPREPAPTQARGEARYEELSRPQEP